MDGLFTIAHLSDLHISLDHSRQNVKMARTLIEYALRQGADHMVVTGDITANAEKKEFEAARKIFRNFGLLDSRKLSLIPGNHDVFGGVHRAEEILFFPKRCKTTDYDGKLAEFHERFHEIFDSSFHEKNNACYPYAKVIDGVAIVGANSVARYSRLGNPIGSNGEVDDGQFQRMKMMLMSEELKTKRKIVLIHHHFNKPVSDEGGTSSSLWGAVERKTMKLRAKRRLLQLFAASSVDIVLHGHVHRNHEYSRKGVKFVNAGGAILGHNHAFNVALIRVTPSGVQTELRKLPQSGAHAEPPLVPEVEQRIIVPEAA